MLFHVTMTHSEDNCPAYQRDKMPEVMAAFEGLSKLGEELNVKLHYFTWTPTDHVAYVLVEADTLTALNSYLFSIPIKQHTKVVPVEHLADTMAMARKMAASG